MECSTKGPGLSEKRDTAIRFLVETALRSVATDRQTTTPRSREEWIERLCNEIMSDSATSHHSVISALISTGVTSREICQSYVPAVARRIGEMWVQDEVTFVQVAVGAARLQSLFRDFGQNESGRWLDRTVPLGQSVLMILPEGEDHTLGAFVASDQFRRHGLWVRMAIRLEPEELVHVVAEGEFALLGMSLSTENAVENVAEMVKYLKSNLQRCPPIVVGGRLAVVSKDAALSTGVDFAVRSVREAIERCGLATVSDPLSSKVLS